MAGKPLWSRVTLRFKAWEGEWCEAGDVLRTTTGRTYEVIERRGRVVTCRVVPPDIRVEGREFSMYWSPRKPRK